MGDIGNMAKAPHVGSRRTVAEFVHDKILKGSKQYKIIQPQTLAFFNESYWWVAKIITIDTSDNPVGIVKKREAGFVIVSEGKKGKYKLEGTYMQNALPVTGTLGKLKKNVVKVERKRR